MVTVILTSCYVLTTAQIAEKGKAELPKLPAVHGVCLPMQYELATTLGELLVNPSRIVETFPRRMRRELKLTDEQIRQMAKARDAAFHAKSGDRTSAPFEDAMEIDFLERLPQFLSKKQSIRFRQLHCQLEGPMVLRHETYAAMAGIAAEQRKMIRALLLKYSESSRSHHASIFASRKGDDMNPHLAVLKRLASELDEKILETLTAEQRAAWNSLLGPAFDWSA